MKPILSNHFMEQFNIVIGEDDYGKVGFGLINTLINVKMCIYCNRFESSSWVCITCDKNRKAINDWDSNDPKYYLVVPE